MVRRALVRLFRLAFGGLGPLPDLIIIGAQKGGTTSLFDHLQEHPSVLRPCEKEIHYFDWNPEKSVRWYRSHFLTWEYLRKRPPVALEASPDYLHDAEAPARAHRVVPDAKLIALLRNPVDRAYSHYCHNVRRGREPLTFEEALAAEPERPREFYSYRARGCYADQLRRWFDVFPKEQILVLGAEAFFAQPGAVLAEVCALAGLEPIDWGEFKRSNRGRYEPLDEALRSRLAEYYEPLNRDLYGLLGTDFGW